MKYPIHLYASALSEAIATKEEKSGKIAPNFISLVVKNGDEAHAAKIVEECESLLRKKDGTKKFVLGFARENRKHPRDILGDAIGPNDVCESVISPELIAGMTITVNDDLRFDGSLKGKLDKMFS